MTKPIPIPTPSPPLSALDDGALLEVVLSRDEQAWRELVRRFRGLIYRCIGKVTCRYESVVGSEDVEEIFADVCVGLLRGDMKKLRAYDPARGSKLGSWLGLLAINCTYDYLRQVRRRPPLDKLENAPDRASGDPDPLDEVLEKERWDVLGAMVADLSARDRRFVELYFGRGLDAEQVATAMSISVKTVYSKKNKIRLRLEAIAAAQRRTPLAA